tara:strand:- start:6 stop:7322 length:7317 start_codon:yes stop_codon:yes gene_type:complete
MFEYEGQQINEATLQAWADDAGIPMEDYIAKYDIKQSPNEGKTIATAEETAPVVAETPADTDLQLEDGSLESPRKSGRLKSRQNDLARLEAKQQDVIANVEDEYYKATEVEDTVSVKKRLSEQLKKQFDQGKFESKDRDLYNQYKANPTVEIKITDEQVEEEIKDQFDAKERTFMEDVPEYAQKALKEKLFIRKEEQEAKYKQSNLEYEDNYNAHNVLTDNLNESVKMGVPPTNEELIAYEKSLADIKKRGSDLIAQQGAMGKTDGILDAFKRSYSDLDMLENTLAKTGVDMALGLMYTLDMAKSEKGKEVSFSKELINLSQELARTKAEDLAKPIAVSSVSNLSQLGEWAGDALINFVPSGAMAMTGGAAVPLFFASGYSSRMAEFAVNEAEAIKNIPEITKQLEETKDPIAREKLNKELDRYNKAVNTDDLTKLATSFVYGGAEAVFERFGTVKLVNDLKAVKKAMPAKTYTEGIIKSVGKLPGGAVVEGGTEGLTTLSQNAADILIDGQNKSYTEGMDEAMAQGALIGTGFKVAEGAAIGRAAMLDVISSREEKAKIQSTLNEISTLAVELNNPNVTKERKKDIGDIITKRVKSVGENQDITSARFLRLTKEQQQEVFELDRQSREVNKRWSAGASDASVSEATKEILRKELETEFNSLQENKRNIIESADKRFKSLQPVEGLSEGDNIRNAIVSETNLQKVKTHNKKAKWANKVVGLSEKDVSNMNEFLEGQETTFTTEGGDVLNKSEVSNIFQNQTGVDGLFDKENKNVVVFNQRAPYYNKAAAIHEYMHAAFMAKGLTQQDFDNVKNDLISHISFDAKDRLSDKQLKSVLTKMESYENKDQSEELFTAISDLINDDIIREQDKPLLSKLRDAIKSSLTAITNPGEAGNFKIDNGKQAFNFIKDFNRKIVKGKAINLGATSQPEDQEGVSLSKIIENEVNDFSSKSNLQGLLDKSNGKVSDFITNSMNDPNTKRFAADLLKSQFGKEIAPVLERVAQRNFDKIAKDATRVVSENYAEARNIWKNDLLTELISEVSNKYNPSEQNLDKFVTIRAYQRSNRTAKNIGIQSTIEKGGQGIGVDIDKAKGVDSGDLDFSETDNRSTSEQLGFDDTIKTEAMRVVKQAVQDTSNKLTGKDGSNKKKADLRNKFFNNFVEKRILPLVRKAIGKNTKNEKAFTNFVSKPANFEVLRDIFLEQIDIQKGSGPAALWNIDNPPSLEEFLDYYEGSGTTKSDRRRSLAKAVSRSIANEARIEFAKKDPATAKLFKEKHGVVLASKILPSDKTLQTLAGIAGFKDGAGMPASNVWKAFGTETNIGFNLSKKEGRKRAIKAMEFALTKGSVPLDAFATGALMINSSPRFFKDQETAYEKAKEEYRKNPTAKNKKLKEEADKVRLKIKNDFTADMDKMIDRIKKEGKATYLTGAAKGWTKNKFSFNKNGTSIEKILESFKNGTTAVNNKANLAMFEQTMQPLYDLVSKDPKMVNLVMMLTNTSNGGSNLWFRLGAEVVGSSSFLLPGKEGTRGIEWEHAMQANNARLFLLNSAINKVPWGTVYPAVKRNYKVIALDKSLDDILKAAKRGNAMGLGWNVYTGHWTERYFHPDVFVAGGIDPSTIVDINGQTLADKYKIDSAGKSTKVMASKILDADFNKMLERVKGVKAEARYSQDRANKLAGNKGKFKFFVPYSAEDYLGLVYPTLGKGKEGDKNLQWYKDNIVNPFAIGIANYEKAKIESLEQWRNLKKQVSKTPAKLNKEATRGFTNEEAVRVYLWNEQDVVPDTLAKKDVEALVKHVKDSKDLTAFAENVKGIVGADGYPAPNENWISGSLTIDLIDNINTTKRSEFLQEWSDNVDVVYSKDNMNKLKAIYGERYTEALENILHRMKTGRNRPSGATRLENQFMNWINDSVGTVMFFNTRSALLQTISSVNFLNWSDNNPLMAGKAFANQPQFWKDFSDLFNSDFLKSRRSGLKNDINADELAKSAASSDNKVRAALSSLLKAGFLPTQIADSFAISIGGASFYRNRYNTYKKDGLSDQEAKDKAMLDFQETTEESQQSSRPDRVSMQQASSLGRVILAFANTPMQYTRLTKKAALDLVNGRGDWKTNTSKILYYGAVQNIIFTALQQAMFAMLFDDDELDDEEQTEASAKIVNGIADTFLRGSGVGGAAVATMKNIIMEIIKQKESKRPDYTKAALKLTTLSPPIDTKIRKLMSAGRAFTYRQSLKDMNSLGVDIDNPAALATGQVLSAVANLPADRAILKMRNVKNALDTEHEAWQRIAMGLGFADWQLGIKDDKSDDSKPDVIKGPTRSKKTPSRGKQNYNGRKSIPSRSKSPTKKLERGVAGVANNDGTIEIDPNLSPVEREKTIAHEEQHMKDMKAGKLNYDDDYVYWNDGKYERKNGKIKYKGKSYIEGHKDLPWEKVAYSAEPSTAEAKKRTKLYA